jgi:hypothetical protein
LQPLFEKDFKAKLMKFRQGLRQPPLAINITYASWQVTNIGTQPTLVMLALSIDDIGAIGSKYSRHW